MKFYSALGVAPFCLMATIAVAQQPKPSVPEGSLSQISDWALAGVIWSDASLTKKLATRAAQESETAERRSRYQALAQQSSELVQAMESFGWKQIKTPTKMAAERSDQSTSAEKTLPDPEKVGDKLAETLDQRRGVLAGASQQDNKRRSRRENAKPVLDPSIKRFDTETPAGRDDPGMDDERTGDGISLDLDNYRVDDYIDETPAEARNRADAIEDGVEGAIAAAAGRRGMGRGTAGWISQRESQTLSATLPYAQDSIYDADDYDPDVDYDVDNPLGTQSTNPASVNLGDRDDDIDLGDPATVVDGEDELIAEMKREQNRERAGATSLRTASSRTHVDNYTADRAKHSQDADWVQFYLDANQSIWSDFTTRENLHIQTAAALIKLKAHMKTAMTATENERLRELLRQL